MFELIYTSTPQGLITGRSGFATVALTEGFPPNLIAPIENLSGYKPLFPPGDKNEEFNPVNFSCQQLQLGKTNYTVLSRISFAGLSYTGRINVLAHHLLFAPGELDSVPGGAVSVLLAEENFPGWSGEPRMLPQKKNIAVRPPAQAKGVWQKLAGDQKWAEYTADCFRTNPGKCFSLAFDPLQISGTEILELIYETAAWLTQDELRNLAFSTYNYSTGISNPLFFRAYVNDSVQLSSIKRLDPQSIIYLGCENTLPLSWCCRAVTEAQKCAVQDTEPEQPDAVAEIPVSECCKLQSEAADCIGAVPGSAAANIGDNGVEVYEPGANKSRYFIIAAIVLLAAVLCALVVWRITAVNKPEEDDVDISLSDQVLSDKERPDIVKIPQRQVTPAVVDNGSRSNKGLSKKIDKPVKPVKPIEPVKKKNTAAASEKNKDRLLQKSVAEMSFGKLNPQELFELYCAIYSGKDFKLPNVLKAASALEVKLKSVGGVQNDIEPAKFVSGNRSRRVVVYSRRSNNNGLMVEWKPDKGAAGQMSLSISGNGIFKFSLSGEPSERSPKISDIETITFISAGGARFSIAAAELPLSIDDHLNRTTGVSAEFRDMSIRFYLKVSDELWIFRSRYSIAVNGRNLGGEIQERLLLLYEINMRSIMPLLHQREKKLSYLREQLKLENNFVRDNKKHLAAPEFGYQPKFGKNKFRRQITAFKNAVANRNVKQIQSVRQEIITELDDLLGNKKISADQYGDFEEALDNYSKRYETYIQHNERLGQIREMCSNAWREYVSENNRLKEQLQNISPIIYHAGRSVLENADTLQSLSPDFYRNVKLETLCKNIKVEIIRR